MKETGGGGFDPAETERLYFIAAQSDDFRRIVPVGFGSVLVATDRFTATNKYFEAMDAALEGGMDFLLDSGTFGVAGRYATQHDLSLAEAFQMDPHQMEEFGKVEERYRLLIDRYEERMWGYIEIDLGSTEIKIANREAMEAEGYKPIPVYHFHGDPLDYFDQLCDDYDRICVGSLVGGAVSTTNRLKILLELQRRARNKSTWIHLLGLPPHGLTSCLSGFQSSDSSDWVAALKYGGESGLCWEGPVKIMPSYFSNPNGEPYEVITKAFRVCASKYDGANQARQSTIQEVLAV